MVAEQTIALRVQHVSVPRPRGSHDATRRFYSEVLGLKEVAVPASLQQLELIWYRLGDSELHLFASDTVPQGLAAHFCIQVDDLGPVRERLGAAGVQIIDDLPIANRPRFFVLDPFGNRIEITSILGPYD
jgi:catechol 2,3-dioxygenase-like lactoylglutathione lyase family enzyme